MRGITFRRQGFTIVELLIVIVVIAILAAITIVAYNGIQQRARNAQVVSGVNAYYKAMINYKTINGLYPTAGGCLGANYEGDQCWMGDSGTRVVSATLDGALDEFIKTKPTLATKRFAIGIGNNMRAGLSYETTTTRFVWYLQGTSQDCGLSGASSVNEGNVVTQCQIALP